MKAEIKNSEALGRILQQARLRQGLTQKQLAEKLGMRQADIWQMETGKSTKYSDRLFDLLRATNIRLTAELAKEVPLRESAPRHREGLI